LKVGGSRIGFSDGVEELFEGFLFELKVVVEKKKKLAFERVNLEEVVDAACFRPLRVGHRNVKEVLVRKDDGD